MGLQSWNLELFGFGRIRWDFPGALSSCCLFLFDPSRKRETQVYEECNLLDLFGFGRIRWDFPGALTSWCLHLSGLGRNWTWEESWHVCLFLADFGFTFVGEGDLTKAR